MQKILYVLAGVLVVAVIAVTAFFLTRPDPPVDAAASWAPEPRGATATAAA